MDIPLVAEGQTAMEAAGTAAAGTATAAVGRAG